MIDLKDYVDELFRHQRLTPEVKDLKEEILSNMTAKMDDLIAQGIEADIAAKKAKESVSTIDYLIDGNQLTDISKYRLECTQTVLLNCIIFWIFSLPLLFTHFATFSYLGLLLTISSGIVYLLQTKQQMGVVAYKRTTQENSLDCLGTVLCCMCRNNGDVDIRKQYLVWQTSQYQRSVSNGECRGTVLYAATYNPYSYYIWQLYKALIEKQKGA